MVLRPARLSPKVRLSDTAEQAHTAADYVKVLHHWCAELWLICRL